MYLSLSLENVIYLSLTTSLSVCLCLSVSLPVCLSTYISISLSHFHSLSLSHKHSFTICLSIYISLSVGYPRTSGQTASPSGIEALRMNWIYTNAFTLKENRWIHCQCSSVLLLYLYKKISAIKIPIHSRTFVFF